MMNMNHVYIALRVMGAGMTGIFVTLSILYGFIIFLTKIYPMKANKQDVPKER
ncbi:hypothetical protein [Alkaliphilus hydrothermalis]|uniref:Na+-transporting methylmalonyl-CoA/oxaloacetate decarboxylase gamma subunit n=1 Tax=Alkaliphilus hydrothermalis TaxID=1482730 RepID=A0ABS2NLE8_9FIRM|nr:hypothetical protein [Alkaliphilus hydrothermalis]MBM7613756.1 Na+-transporting methylmalonyl-CoA/oxaloacetate decarboxylase gamma subunit [Alkaliphilus hydrothermalis]